MARRAVPLTAWATATLLGGMTLGTVAVVLARGWADGSGITAADLSALRFTVLQAALSAALSAAFAIPLARALARRSFPGRGALIALLGAPFLLPTIVAVLALLVVFGRRGWLAQALAPLGLGLDIYGLQGVLLAHVFLNLPLATRMLLQGWQSIPAERLRLAQSLNFDPRATWQHLEKPMLLATLPGAALSIFTICLSSFAVALTLGGGPAATTVELAIYQALRFEFALPRAAMLSGIQFALCSAAVLLALAVTSAAPFGAGLDRRAHPLAPGGWRRTADAIVIALSAAFVLLPMLTLALRGLPSLADLPAAVWPAALRSLSVALLAGGLATAAALILALASAEGSRLTDLAASLPLAASSLVVGTGLFLLLHPLMNPATAALPVTALVNATLSAPFAYRILLPDARALQADYGRLSAALGLRGMARLRYLILPRLRRPLGFAMGVSAALCMGDLGVIALFATEGGATLPLLVQRLMGAYRMDQAMGAALVLVSLSFALFALFDTLGRHDPDT